MRIFKLLILFFVFISCAAKAKQDNFLRHNVEKGETIYQISRKYQITPFDIYRLNPDAKNGIQEGTVLLIPKTTTAIVKTETKNIIHEVKAKETLYSIAREYEVTVPQLEEWNVELLKDGLKKGQEIIVGKESLPVNENYLEVQSTKNTIETFSHKVQPQETLYGVSKKYGITIEDIIALNPDSKDGLKEGTILTLKRKIEKTVTVINNNTDNDVKLYTVKPRQTFFSLTRELNISKEELVALNPDLKDGLKEGMILKLPYSDGVSKKADSIYFEKKVVNLVETINKNNKKNLVLLLPFNLSKLDGNATTSIKQTLKENPLLNLSLEFYSGAIMAIDSARVLGLPLNVKILDVESSRTSSNISKLILENDFSNVDAVIGPFQNSLAEKTAELLLKDSIPVISPLSKEVGMKYPNLYNAVPSEDYMMNKLFSHFEKNNGNVIAVVSTKKGSTKEYLVSRYPGVKFPGFNDKGGVDTDKLKTLLVKDKKNFVIIESETTSQILNVTNLLIKLKSDYDIQLVVLKLYDTLDFEEIPMTNLTELNMLFPSNRKEIETESDKVFANKYLKENGTLPSSAAARGFDVTFDTILRIYQEEGYAKSVQSNKTEYFENTFDYVNDNGNIINNGVYLMYYDTDYSIKKVKEKEKDANF
ncbi:LysM peptidoglycan-binding domain-containing protein [Flavobacterium jejuense]|uniref:LysM peptidoglycan-binding domain-containing protein n=1 Tax=Flavobacterium jejuense TaxID=1544455 RepID=A0ABX0ISL3_9FLAO|nr:LysM peptidoglycan-binding domain-containing protein [Flavobacterium jejuense]NHN26857.1 LysM peptidoglycan-binding domain-containing protein [Flavobacterium jejuense]